ncbi:hypothetical protein D3C78_1019390 [compost metagenome]
MAERTNTKNKRELVLGAKVYEVTKIAVLAPVKNAFLFLVIVPKHICRDNLDAARLHLEQLFLPVQIREARKVKFPDYRYDRLFVMKHIIIGKAVAFADRIRPLAL